MLVRDPAKRYTLKMVRKHVWMQSDIKAAQAAKIYTRPSAAKGPIVINEQILRVMQSLGIDPMRTAESVKNDSYDHHAAIYFLLQDKLSSSNMPKTNKTSTTASSTATSSGSAGQDSSSPEPKKPIPMGTPNPEDVIPEHQRRRPSTIAEQATLNCYKDLQGLRDYNSSTSTAPHPTAFTAQQPLAPQTTPQHCWKTPGAENAPPGSPASKMSSGMSATDFSCLTCGLPILENTTSTTTCVKCARLRTRRRNFAQPWTEAPLPGVVLHPPQKTPSIEDRVTSGGPPGKVRNDSKDSGVSSGSSQDNDLATPPIEKTLIFPRFPTPRTDRPSVPFSQLVRKLSEVEGIPPNINIIGKTSLDEGIVDVYDANETSQHRVKLSSQQVNSFEGGTGGSSHSYGAIAQKAFARTAPCSQTSSCFTSTESYPYESLDESVSTAQTPLGDRKPPGVPLIYPVLASDLNVVVGDNNELTQSLPSCNNSITPVTMPISVVEPGASEMELVMSSEGTHYSNVHQSLMQQHQNYQMVMQQQMLQQQQSQQGNLLSVTDATGQRQLMRSPVSFREGRRASDGLVAQAGFVAFQQRLYDKGKAHGFIELHDVHLEHRALQHQFGGSGSNSSSRSGTPDSSLQPQGAQPTSTAVTTSTGSTTAESNQPISGNCPTTSGTSTSALRPSISKRISVPENFTYFPTSSSSETTKVSGLNPASDRLQQQLMQHRIYQKRQNCMPGGKSALMLSTSARRNLLTRQSGLKGANKPYMPQDIYNTSASMCGGISNDFLFQPIAEDESDTAGSGGNEAPAASSSSGMVASTSSASSGMVLLAVPTCMSMPSSPTPSRPQMTPPLPPPTSRTPPVILMEEDVEEVMSIDLTSAHATLTTSSLTPASDPYWQALPGHMAESCRLEATSPSPLGSTRRLNPPNKLEVTKVSPSSPNRSPLLQTGSCKVEPPPLKLNNDEGLSNPGPTETSSVVMSSPETMDISPK